MITFSFDNDEDNSDIFPDGNVMDENSFHGLFGQTLPINFFIENNKDEPFNIINSKEKCEIFKVKKEEKRGRKKENLLGKKIHKSTDKDNVLCKIQIHFLNFLVDFANDAIKTEFKEMKKDLEFKQIEHKIKIQISYKKLKKIMNEPIKEILKEKISNKYRKYSQDKDHNKNLYNKLINNSKWLMKLFDMLYLDIFRLYYNDCKGLDAIEFEGKTIHFSKKTKSFYDLYVKVDSEEEKLKLKKMIEYYYLKEQNLIIYNNELSEEI